MGSKRRLGLNTGLVALGLAAQPVLAAPFPPELDLSGLLPANGGNGDAGFVLDGIAAGDGLGISVTGAGDVNGDGIEDLLVGAFHADPGGQTGSGQSYIVFGRDPATGGFPAELELSDLLSANGGNGSVGFVLNGIDMSDRAGVRVSEAGDVNGDGVDDLLVAADLADPSGQVFGLFIGQCYVIFGRNQASGGFPPEFELSSLLAANGGNGSEGFVLNGIDVGDRAGSSVSAAGDVNGDGINDLLIGALEADPGGRNEAGESYVVFGRIQGAPGFPAEFELSSLLPANGGDGSAGFVLNGIDVDDFSGAVSRAGDVNGDGIGDLVVGALGGDPGGRTDAGERYVVFGKDQAAGGFPAEFELSSLLPANGGNGSAGFVLNGIDAHDLESISPVSMAGDVNHDGIDDLLLGADQADPGGRSGAGESYVVFGRNNAAGGFPAEFELSSLLPANGGNGSAGFILNGIDVDDFSGQSVSEAGDVNDDGVDDLLVGAPQADPGGRSSAGESYVVFGRNQATSGFPAEFELSSLLPTNGGNGSAGFILNGIDVDDLSAVSVSSAGDVNSDGVGDLLVGAVLADPGRRIAAGESYVVFGRPMVPMCDGVAATIVGTSAADVLVGTAGPDVIQGLDGNDAIHGRGGEDILCGGAGNDAINGNGDNDRLLGEAGRDSLFGGAGEDRLNGGEDNDRLFGGANRDDLQGALGNDALFGEAGNDGLFGGDGADQLFGGSGDDRLAGGDGDDRLSGEEGNDAMDGGPAFDRCNGNGGIADTAANCEQIANVP